MLKLEANYYDYNWSTLCPEKLKQVLEAERDSDKEFQVLPFHYVEISRLLFDQWVLKSGS